LRRCFHQQAFEERPEQDYKQVLMALGLFFNGDSFVYQDI
jgi:hypothetical protein